MAKVNARKTTLYLAGYFLVIIPILALISLGVAVYFADEKLGSTAEQTVFMLFLIVGFLVLMLLLVCLGVSLRTEAKHLGEEWPPKITQ